jgi:hypothetical protein
MSQTDYLIETFKQVTENVFNKYSPKRLLDESIYFEAYLCFLNNSIYYSRFKYNSNGKNITGKYLNEKVNKWNKLKIFDKIYKCILKKYMDEHNEHMNHFAIDSQFIRNRFMTAKKVGRNKFYKNKNGLKLSVIVNDIGIPLSIALNNGKTYDSKILIDTCQKMLINTS